MTIPKLKIVDLPLLKRNNKKM